MENKDKENNKLGVVIALCVIFAGATYGLSILFLVFYLIKNSKREDVKNLKNTFVNSSPNTKNNSKEADNLYEALKDNKTDDYYKYDVNDISQKEIHEHKEDFWNTDGPIKYK